MTLLVKPHQPDPQGVTLDITPQSAGWRYVGFRVLHLKAAQIHRDTAPERETCLVILSGHADVAAGSKRFEGLGQRDNVFEGMPTSVYVPAGTSYEIVAQDDCQVAVCSAPAAPRGEPVLIAPDSVKQEVRGKDTNTRHVRNILSEADTLAQSLLVVEVITPGGHWSSYPPHKHDRDALPRESFLEETYYHRFNPPQGFGFQRVYTDDRSIDETLNLTDGCVVMVPRGYHPVASAHGYELYYLNVMAGPKRTWLIQNDPDHAWMLKN
jgi:5-deoxy-glucuronate isomerase